ncbi:hypothetical protein MKW94_014141 [Papaver nudicaule]|uniref:Uncharacterized protein n=1 Tax=Papaver nudicaule TaxID=74823 RepID=A0AA41UWM6_PAPNU|nr:hypothetical protein [Papaver nudicaule]
MEKLKLARNICKTVYGLRFRSIDQRVRNTAQKFNTLRDELSSVRTDPELNEEAQLVLRLTEQYSKAVGKLGRDYTHFKVLLLFSNPVFFFFFRCMENQTLRESIC